MIVGSGQFLLWADPCILSKSDVVYGIITTLNLPPEKTDLDRDAHYRCAKCLSAAEKMACPVLGVLLWADYSPKSNRIFDPEECDDESSAQRF